MQQFSKILRWVNLAVILLTFLSYLSPYINPIHFWPLTFLGMAYPWLLLLNLLFILFWAFRKDRYVFFSLACILTGWSHLTGFVGWRGPEVYDPGKSLSILSYNLQSGRDYETIRQLKKPQSGPLHATLHQKTGNNILCFQEIRKAYLDEMSEALALPYLHTIPYSSVAILSPVPILDRGGQRFTESSNGFIWVDLNLQGQRVRIFNIHLQSNKVSGVTDKVLEAGDLQEKETWMDIRMVIGRVKRATITRSEQVDVVAEQLAASPYPVIVCGDFNDTPQSYSYRSLSQGLRDSFREKGWGFGTTYAGNIPALRIDYILVDPRFKVLETQIPRVPYSDHYPVISKLELGGS